VRVFLSDWIAGEKEFEIPPPELVGQATNPKPIVCRESFLKRTSVLRLRAGKQPPQLEVFTELPLLDFCRRACQQAPMGRMPQLFSH
jgi:hypothetical protein